ncbi:MAG TPA: hypothetical protein VKU77_25930 [Streptosporangiaceae bacterium]|nr:hypothetical protein [Streptosporangiaceae bacterium]
MIAKTFAPFSGVKLFAIMANATFRQADMMPACLMGLLWLAG